MALHTLLALVLISVTYSSAVKLSDLATNTTKLDFDITSINSLDPATFVMDLAMKVHNYMSQGSGRDIQTQDTTGVITAVIDKIHKLWGGDLSTFGFAISFPIAVATAIFWGIVFIIIYHIFFAKKAGEFGKFNFFKDEKYGGSGDAGWADDFKRKTTFPIPTSTLNQLAALVNKAIKSFKG